MHHKVKTATYSTALKLPKGYLQRFLLCLHGACFSKVPKLYGPFSGVTIVVKLPHQFAFCYLENMLKERLANSQNKCLFWPKKFSGPLINGPLGFKGPLFLSYHTSMFESTVFFGQFIIIIFKKNSNIPSLQINVPRKMET